MRRFLADEEGLETVEYAIIAGIVVGATAVAIGAIALLVSQKFEGLQSALKPAGTGS